MSVVRSAARSARFCRILSMSDPGLLAPEPASASSGSSSIVIVPPRCDRLVAGRGLGDGDRERDHRRLRGFRVVWRGFDGVEDALPHDRLAVRVAALVERQRLRDADAGADLREELADVVVVALPLIVPRERHRVGGGDAAEGLLLAAASGPERDNVAAYLAAGALIPDAPVLAVDRERHAEHVLALALRAHEITAFRGFVMVIGRLS